MYSSLKNQERYVQSLTDPLKLSLDWYTGGNFDEFNVYLRREQILPKKYRQHFENITTAFYNSPPLNTPLIVYKGKNSPKVYSDKAFVSTTLEYAKTKRFSGKDCCVVQITVSPGSHVLPLRSISREPDEEEVLLDRNGTLVITGSTVKNQMKVIFATYVPYGAKAVTEQKDINADKFDSKLIVERMIEFFKDEDPEFLDDEELSIMYKKLSGRVITESDLMKIKKRLGV